MNESAAVAGSGREFDHEEVRRVFGAAARAVRVARETASPTVDAARAAVAAIEGLEQVLLAHFAYEEAESGFFAEALGMAPARAHELEALRRSHPDLVARIAAIADRARWAGLSGDSWKRVAASFGEFARRLERHEHSEELLMADMLASRFRSGTDRTP